MMTAKDQYARDAAYARERKVAAAWKLEAWACELGKLCRAVQDNERGAVQALATHVSLRYLEGNMSRRMAESIVLAELDLVEALEAGCVAESGSAESEPTKGG